MSLEPGQLQTGLQGPPGRIRFGRLDPSGKKEWQEGQEVPEHALILENYGPWGLNKITGPTSPEDAASLVFRTPEA